MTSPAYSSFIYLVAFVWCNLANRLAWVEMTVLYAIVEYAGPRHLVVIGDLEFAVEISNVMVVLGRILTPSTNDFPPFWPRKKVAVKEPFE